MFESIIHHPLYPAMTEEELVNLILREFVHNAVREALDNTGLNDSEKGQQVKRLTGIIELLPTLESVTGDIIQRAKEELIRQQILLVLVNSLPESRALQPSR